jgi:hypothetical protein
MPLAALAGVIPHEVRIGGRWMDGYVPVTFEYRIKAPVKSFADRCRKEPFMSTDFYSKVGDSYVMYRRHGGVHQHVSVNKRVTEFHLIDGKMVREPVDENVTRVNVTERVEDFEYPFAFYSGARVESPPVPMVEVPFAPGVMTRAVSIGSFNDAMSSSGHMQGGSDARSYSAVLHGLYADVMRSFERWAASNGYTKTKDHTWFRPGSGFYEIEMRSTYPLKVVAILHWSARTAEHPIYRGERI